MKFDELFSHNHALPTIPWVVHELINALQNEHISVSEVARKIELDQVILPSCCAWPTRPITD